MAATTPNRGYSYPEPGDRIENFPAAQKSTVEKIDTDMDEALTGTLAAARIPALGPDKLNTAAWSSIDSAVAAAVAAANKTTGIRDMTSAASSHLDPENTGTIRVIRTGPLVEFFISNVKFNANNAWVNMFTLPAGFRPYSEVNETVFYGATDAFRTDHGGVSVRAIANPSVAIRKMTTGLAFAHFTYMSIDPFPTAYPGTPA